MDRDCLQDNLDFTHCYVHWMQLTVIRKGTSRPQFSSECFDLLGICFVGHSIFIDTTF